MKNSHFPDTIWVGPIKPSWFVIHCKGGRTLRDGLRPGLRPQLLGVCRQVNTEAKAFLYGQRLDFADMPTLANFLLYIYNDVPFLKNVVVHGWDAEEDGTDAHWTRDAIHRLMRATSLEHLHIVNIALPTTQRLPPSAARRFSEKAKPLLTALKGQHGVEELLDIITLHFPVVYPLMPELPLPNQSDAQKQLEFRQALKQRLIDVRKR